MSAQNLLAIRPVAIEICQSSSGPAMDVSQMSPALEHCFRCSTLMNFCLFMR